MITPAISSGLLPGITRKMVLQLAREAGFHVEESLVQPERLSTVIEAFLTNSLLEIMPLVAVDGQPGGTGRVGPVVQRLQELYRKTVKEKLG